jgi:hypothetical protein
MHASLGMDQAGDYGPQVLFTGPSHTTKNRAGPFQSSQKLGPVSFIVFGSHSLHSDSFGGKGRAAEGGGGLAAPMTPYMLTDYRAK